MTDHHVWTDGWTHPLSCLDHCTPHLSPAQEGDTLSRPRSLVQHRTRPHYDPLRNTRSTEYSACSETLGWIREFREKNAILLEHTHDPDRMLYWI